MGKNSQETGATTDAGQPVSVLSPQPTFHGSRPQVTGSKGGNAALKSLMSALSQLGLVIDQTS